MAEGAVVASQGGDVLLATVVTAATEQPWDGSTPLSVDFVHRQAARGALPGRRPEVGVSDDEVLDSRLVDRALRPVFARGFARDTHVVCTQLSVDVSRSDWAPLAITAASAAACVAPRAPVVLPVAGVRVAHVDGEIVVGPTAAQRDAASFHLLYAGDCERVTMLEAEGPGAPLPVVRAVLAAAAAAASRGVEAQTALLERLGRTADAGWTPDTMHPLTGAGFVAEEAAQAAQAADIARDTVYARARDAFAIGGDRRDRAGAQARLQSDGEAVVRERLPLAPPGIVAAAVEGVVMQAFRDSILESCEVVPGAMPGKRQGGKRVDGRSTSEIRPLHCEVSTLPTPHGSSLFARGNTATACTATLGERERQLPRGPVPQFFHLSYNFPPYATNEIGRITRNRRMVGHSALAEKALRHVAPDSISFPYTVAVSSEVLGSDGSSSMATVCGASLALMDAGVPMPPVAGISVGLVTNLDHSRCGRDDPVTEYAVLTDILGMEDHFGDMDLKVAGTADAVTAIQLDVKLPGVPLPIIDEATAQADMTRAEILAAMSVALPAARAERKPHTPHAFAIKVPLDEIGSVILQGREIIRDLEERTGARLWFEGEYLFGIVTPDHAEETEELCSRLTRSVDVGDVVTARVITVHDFGYKVEYGLNKTGLLHVSELTHKRVEHPLDLLSPGDYLELVCIGRDSQDAVKFSRKQLVKPEAEGGTDTGVGDKRTLPFATSPSEVLEE